MKRFFGVLKNYIFAHKIISGILGIILIISTYNILKPRSQQYQLIEVKKSSITQEVEVTGRVVPVSNLSLAFEQSGRVIAVRHDVGEYVHAGEPLAILDQADFSAKVAQAKASAASEQANLDSLEKGTRPEEIQIKQTALDQANQDLQNSYGSVLQTLESAYINANDAVRKQASDLFTQAETSLPILNFVTSDIQAQIDSSSGRYLSGLELNSWRNELNALYASSTTNASLDQALLNAANHLTIFRNFVNRTNDTLVKAANLSSAAITTYKTEITTAGTEVSTYLTNINTAIQTISSKKIAVQSAVNNLALAKAGYTPEEIEAQKARLAAALANVQSAEAAFAKTVLIAPINGTITKQDAKVGQIVSPNTALVGLISESRYEIDANVPEVDIGKMAVRNKVNLTFDALPNENFSGKVFFIDPAETVIDGAVNFKIKISLDKPDERVKSGFTANLSIITQTKENVLILPQFAILQNDQGIFVKKAVNRNYVDSPVTLGITSKDGMVEIVSGVSEGEKVANIGLKSSAK